MGEITRDGQDRDVLLRGGLSNSPGISCSTRALVAGLCTQVRPLRPSALSSPVLCPHPSGAVKGSNTQ